MDLFWKNRLLAFEKDGLDQFDVSVGSGVMSWLLNRQPKRNNFSP